MTTRDQPSSAELSNLDKTSEELDTDDVVDRFKHEGVERVTGRQDNERSGQQPSSAGTGDVAG